MSKSQLKPTKPQPSNEFRKITIEVHEDVARRLENSAERYARYQSEGDVAAECVHLYLGLLEAVDEETNSFKDRQVGAELRRITKAINKKPNRKKIQPKKTVSDGI